MPHRAIHRRVSRVEGRPGRRHDSVRCLHHQCCASPRYGPQITPKWKSVVLTRVHSHRQDHQEILCGIARSFLLDLPLQHFEQIGKKFWRPSFPNPVCEASENTASRDPTYGFCACTILQSNIINGSGGSECELMEHCYRLLACDSSLSCLLGPPLGTCMVKSLGGGGLLLLGYVLRTQWVRGRMVRRIVMKELVDNARNKHSHRIHAPK